MLKNVSLRFLRDGGYRLPPLMLPVGYSENVLPLIRKICSAPIERVTDRKDDGEFQGRDAADMPLDCSDSSSEVPHADGGISAMRKELEKQGPKKLHETKANVSAPQASQEAHCQAKKLPDKAFQPCLLQVVLHTPANALRTVLDKWVEDGNCLETNDLLPIYSHLRTRRLHRKALQVTDLLAAPARRPSCGAPTSPGPQLALLASVALLPANWVVSRLKVIQSYKPLYLDSRATCHARFASEKFVEWVERGELLNFEERDYASHLHSLARYNGIEAAQKYIERVPKSFRNQVLYETLLATCGRLANVQKAEEVFQEIMNLSLPLTVSACNQMLSLYKRLARKKVGGILTLMEKENVKPSPFTYKLLIDLNARSNDTSGMGTVLNMMKVNGVEPDVATQTQIAKFYISRGLTEKAEEAIRAMEVYVNDKRCAIRSLLDLYAILGRQDDVARIWKLCTEPKFRDYLAAIEAWGKLGHIEQAEETFETLLRTSPKVTSKHFNAMLNVYAQNRLMSKGKELLERMHSAGLPGRAPPYDFVLEADVNAFREGMRADKVLPSMAVIKKLNRPKNLQETKRKE